VLDRPPARRDLGGALVGAVLGVVARWVTLTIWPTGWQALVGTLITICVGCLLMGFVAVRTQMRTVASATAGFAGAIASVSILAVNAISSSPAGCAMYVVLTPMAAIAGLALGLLMGIGARDKAHAVVDHV
jgi:hypothetical protein